MAVTMRCLTVLSWMQASADSQGSSRQMVGEETPAAYVHPAQEATAIEQADGSALARPSMQHVRTLSSEALPAAHEVTSPHSSQQKLTFLL